MALSHIVKKLCSVCNKPLVETSRIDFGDSFLVAYECGHVQSVEKLTSESYEIVSLTKHYKTRPYQAEGIEFILASNLRALVADEQGLGKTIQAIGALKLRRSDALPAVVVTKTTVTHQWYHELVEWLGKEGLIYQVIKSGKEKALPGLQVYITSFDLIKKHDDMFSLCSSDEEYKIRTVIIDECQAIKNHLSDRARALQDFTRDKEHIIGLSGTPIKNNAGEYFTILNILQPSRFPTYQGYLDRYCDTYEQGQYTKIGGLSNPELFHDMTKDFIIRRTREQAAPDIPKVDRQFFHVELDKKFNNAYRDAMKELDELFYEDETSETMTNMMAIMAKMRRITGISKVDAAVDYATEFLLNNPGEKLVIFAHHHDAVTFLVNKLNQWLKDGGYGEALNLNSSLDGDARARLVSKFKDDANSRIMVASTLAAGEGLNLQFVRHAIMLERQWNPANEEQAEGRFARIGATGHIVVQYFIASETIDEYFTELVETKRAIVANTLDGKEMNWDQTGLMKELAGILVTKGKKKWSL